MIRTPVVAAATLLALVACGGSAPAAAKGPTVQTVSAQQSDVPSGLVKCGLTGDINSFLDKQKGDQETYDQTRSSWESAQQKGARAAYTAFYTDSTAHCSAIQGKARDIAAADYKLVVNFVVQFKDEKSAASNYSSGSIFGLSTSGLRSGGQPVLEGTKTGLTPNSISLSVAVPPQSFYIALWQNKTFVVTLVVLNLDPEASKQVATLENSRIK